MGRILCQDSSSSLKPHLKIRSPKEGSYPNTHPLVTEPRSDLRSRLWARTLSIMLGLLSTVAPSLKVESHFILKVKY